MRVTVVLVRPQGPVNVGLAARACGNLGASLRIVEPLCDVRGNEARQFANHAVGLLQEAVWPSLTEAVADAHWAVATTARARAREVRVPLWEVGAAAIARGVEHLAVVFGNEAHGLTDDELHACQGAVHIPTPGDYPSYNLSHAVAIALYAVLGQPQEQVDTAVEPSVEVESLKALRDQWLRVLSKAGYFRRTSEERYRPTLWRMLNRLRIGAQDHHTLRGMLTHLEGSVEHDSPQH